jgi:hypothetical protein
MATLANRSTPQKSLRRSCSGSRNQTSKLVDTWAIKSRVRRRLFATNILSTNAKLDRRQAT